jgi:hypothetical protein
MIAQKWANIEDEASPYTLLRRLGDRIGVESIDILWIFPTRRSAGIESTVVAVAAFDADHEARRRVGAVRWLVDRDRKGRATIDEQVHEYALAPVDAIHRVVDGVMRRLGDTAHDAPRERHIAGDPERWTALLRELGAPPDPADTGPVAGTVASGSPSSD